MSNSGFFKCACQGCAGRLEVPAEAIGVVLPCPHCNELVEIALKCACQDCGGPLSFPSAAIAMQAQCGHCQGATLLMPSAILAGGTQQPKAAPSITGRIRTASGGGNLPAAPAVDSDKKLKAATTQPMKHQKSDHGKLPRVRPPRSPMS